MLRRFRNLEHDLDYGDDTAIHGASGPIPIVRWHRDELLPVQQAFARRGRRRGPALGRRPQRARLHRHRARCR